MPIVTASTIRNHPHALSAQVKSLNYLNNVMAKVEAIQAGAKDFIVKPFKPDAVVTTLAKVVEKPE